MTLLTEEKQTVQATVTDRRRPGRHEVSPELIPILRGGGLGPTLDEQLELEQQDQLAGMRGIFSGVAFSVPLWVAMAYVGRWLLS